ncbi:uncharacterized protein K02A2.6-like [Ornithodoros turicata]|uniref:uncharacterized protein K02A2.6-like n=1 Tax=Ornithodoros turicata TaxID=34597 RepID=UPI003138ABF3
MSARVGRLLEFDQSHDNFNSYMERFEHYVTANDISEDKKKATFLTVIGAKTYEVLKNLVVPDVPGNKSYRELKGLLEEHYSPKPSIIAERCKFNRRCQEAHESVEDFTLALKELARKCEFDSFLNDALRDRLVAGLKCEETQRALFAMDDLTFEKACKTARDKEQAAKQTSQMHQRFPPDVNMVRLDSTKTANAQRQRKTGKAQKCYRCGKFHDPNQCWYKEYRCSSCSKVGHLKKMCRCSNNRRRNVKKVDCVEESVETESSDDAFMVYSVTAKAKGYSVIVSIEGQPVSMIVDTGASVSIMPKQLYEERFKKLPCQQTEVVLRTYAGGKLTVVGKLQVNVQYEGQSKILPIVVVDDCGEDLPLLLGRDWLQTLKLNWNGFLHYASKDPAVIELQTLKDKYSSVFRMSPGVVRNFEAQVVVKEASRPVFCKARAVPFALREQVIKELDSLEKEGILKRVSHSEWATPLVCVPKKDGQGLRLCGDYKITINPVLKTDHYPLPHPEELFAKLVGGNVFCVLDLAAAYQQVKLSPASKKLLTVNTPLGLFEYQRLPFGISSAPAIFQALMDQVLKDIPKVGCYIDDVIIAGKDLVDCKKTLEEVLLKLQEHGLTIKEKKCQFFRSSVTYLGHQITSQGIFPTDTKTKAIVKAPEPCNKTELQAYLGLLNFYGRFLRNVSTVAAPLYELLKKDQPWRWTPACKRAFEDTKQLLVKSKCLVYYDVRKPLGLICDASAYGLGAIIFHIMSDGSERPIAFASRTLTASEKNYAQCEKEALAIIFGLKRFHRYLYGRHFVIYTDHQPLLGILAANKAIPALAAARIQRWALTLSAYSYALRYRKGQDMQAADALSRLPLASQKCDPPPECLAFFNVSPITAKDIAEATKRDKIISRVADYTLNGWAASFDEQYRPFFARRDELSLEQGCVTWGTRVVVPEQLRPAVLSILHEEHPGINRMKMLARNFVWWPGLDSQVEEQVRKCRICQAVQASVPTVPHQPWTYPARIWQRIHLDFATHTSVNLLVVIDSYSKWVEVFSMKSTTTTATIARLRKLFSAYGYPEEIVSDNGPQFTSQEFQAYMQTHGVKHTKTPPYHPSSNGAAERLVQTTKKTLRKQVLQDHNSGQVRPISERIDSFLMAYRNTPSTVTGKTPAELFLKRTPRTILSLLKPSFLDDMRNNQGIDHQKSLHRRKPRLFSEGQPVYVKTVRGEGIAWEEGTIVSVVSPVTFVVNVNEQDRFVHSDHLRCRSVFPETFAKHKVPVTSTRAPSPSPQQPPDVADINRRDIPSTPPPDKQAATPERTRNPSTPRSQRSPSGQPATQDAGNDQLGFPSTSATTPQHETPVIRTSSRVSRLPDRYQAPDFRK